MSALLFLTGDGRVEAIGGGRFLGIVECSDGMRIETAEHGTAVAACMAMRTICRQLDIRLSIRETVGLLPGPARGMRSVSRVSVDLEADRLRAEEQRRKEIAAENRRRRRANEEAFSRMIRSGQERP